MGPYPSRWVALASMGGWLELQWEDGAKENIRNDD